MLHTFPLIIKAAAALIMVKRPKQYTFTELRTMAKPATGLKYRSNYSFENFTNGRMPF